MGSPPYKCPCCAKPGAATVQVCDTCNGRVCVKHIRFSHTRWVCTRCERLIAKQVQKTLVMRNSG